MQDTAVRGNIKGIPFQIIFFSNCLRLFFFFSFKGRGRSNEQQLCRSSNPVHYLRFGIQMLVEDKIACNQSLSELFWIQLQCGSFFGNVFVFDSNYSTVHD
jgi:hypothetical protein